MLYALDRYDENRTLQKFHLLIGQSYWIETEMCDDILRLVSYTSSSCDSSYNNSYTVSGTISCAGGRCDDPSIIQDSTSTEMHSGDGSE